METAGKVLGEFGKLKRMTKANSGLGVPTMVKLYKGMVEPMLLYGCEIWGEEMMGS